MTHWHEDGGFWEHFAPVLMGEQRIREAAAEVEHIARLTELSPGSAVLDMGCGPGRHAVEFAARGFEVSGVDPTRLFLELARTRARQRDVAVEWIQDDIRRFRRPRHYDLVVCLFTSFGYFEDPQEDRRSAANLHDCLKPGGRVVFDVMGKEILARIFRPRDWRREEDGSLWIELRDVRDGWGWVDVHQTVIKDGAIREYSFGHRPYSAAELSRLLSDVGFEDIRTFGALQGRPYNHEAERLVCLARKPEPG